MYSNGELSLLKKLSRLHPAVILDGGANTGNYTAAVRQTCPKALVYALEPVTETYSQLAQRFRQDKQVIPINQGLFSENTVKTICLYPSSTHSSLYSIQGINTQVVSEAQVELITGDDLMRTRDLAAIDLLKLDLEGAEYDALCGFEDALRRGAIRLVQFEYGYINITTRRLLLDFYNLLGDYGYAIGKLFPKTVEFRTYSFKHEDFIGPNFAAVRKEDEELIRLLSSK